MRPRLLDTFCKAGGCSRGYVMAGFDVTGVDIEPQKNYLKSGATAFIQADALEFIRDHGSEFDAIHASPPCQRYSSACFTPERRNMHPDLLDATRQVLRDLGRPFVIENVVGAPLSRWSIWLCGLMFGLKVFRHRGFESSAMLMQPPHVPHRGKLIGVDGMRCPIGHGGWASQRHRNKQAARDNGERDTAESWQVALGIDWMTRNEMAQSIPPSYTEFIGRQLLNVLDAGK